MEPRTIIRKISQLLGMLQLELDRQDVDAKSGCYSGPQVLPGVRAEDCFGDEITAKQITEAADTIALGFGGWCHLGLIAERLNIMPYGRHAKLLVGHSLRAAGWEQGSHRFNGGRPLYAYKKPPVPVYAITPPEESEELAGGSAKELHGDAI